MCPYTGEYTGDFTDSTGYGGHLGDLAMDTLALEMVVSDEENGCGFKFKIKGKKPVDPHTTCVGYSCQEKYAGVLL